MEQEIIGRIGRASDVLVGGGVGGLKEPGQPS